MVILDAVQNFKSVGQVVRILQTGPFFTQFLPKLLTFWTMDCRIDLKFCTASSITIIYLWSKFQVHTIFQSWDIQIQGIFGQKKAKMPILGRSAKYTWVTGGKIDPTPLNYKSYAVHRQKMSQKYWSEKKLEGVSILGVVKKWWRHHGSMTSPMMTKFCQEMSIHNWCTLAKFHPEIQSLSKVIKNFRSGGACRPPPQDARRFKTLLP